VCPLPPRLPRLYIPASSLLPHLRPHVPTFSVVPPLPSALVSWLVFSSVVTACQLPCLLTLSGRCELVLLRLLLDSGMPSERIASWAFALCAGMRRAVPHGARQQCTVSSPATMPCNSCAAAQGAWQPR